MTNLLGYSIVSTTELNKQKGISDVLLATANLQQKLLIEQEQYIKTLESSFVKYKPDCGCHKSNETDWFETVIYAMLFIALFIAARNYYKRNFNNF